MTSSLAAWSEIVPRETVEVLEAYRDLVLVANATQNLVASSTAEAFWERHILDSAQLTRFQTPGPWIDIGSGAGLPGIVSAIITGKPTTLVEPRRLRCEFLADVKDRLGLRNLTIVRGKPGAVPGKFGTITARAVASAAALFDMTFHLATRSTVWIFPKGRSAQKELDESCLSWQGEFRLEPSMTDPAAAILIATRIGSRKGRAR